MSKRLQYDPVPMLPSWVELHDIRKNHAPGGMRENQWFEEMEKANPSCPGCKHLVVDCRCICPGCNQPKKDCRCG